MNRKGFTLIEVLAVVVILGIVLVIAAPNLLNIYKDSKLKSEELFVGRLSDVLDSYITLNSGDISFTGSFSATKEEAGGSTYSVDIKNGEITINDVIEDSLLSSNDYVNAGNKIVLCNTSAKVEVYRDSDYVYCYKMRKDELNCLTDEYKASISGDYVIDTCIWS